MQCERVQRARDCAQHKDTAFLGFLDLVLQELVARKVFVPKIKLRIHAKNVRNEKCTMIKFAYAHLHIASLA